MTLINTNTILHYYIHCYNIIYIFICFVPFIIIDYSIINKILNYVSEY